MNVKVRLVVELDMKRVIRKTRNFLSAEVNKKLFRVLFFLFCNSCQFLKRGKKESHRNA